MDNRTIIINKTDIEELNKLYAKAETMPMLLIGNVNIAERAWDKVREKMDELGKKYDFDPEKIQGIMPNGEVVF
jgi:hypothetical protein